MLGLETKIRISTQETIKQNTYIIFILYDMKTLKTHVNELKFEVDIMTDVGRFN